MNKQHYQWPDFNLLTESSWKEYNWPHYTELTEEDLSNFAEKYNDNVDFNIFLNDKKVAPSQHLFQK